MNIIVNTIPLLSPLTGIGQYTYQIARALRGISPAHTYSYFYGYYSHRLISPGENLQAFNRLKEAIHKVPILGMGARNLQGFLNYFSAREFDLYFEPHFMPLNLTSRRTIVSIPDFSVLRFPEWHRKDRVRYFQKHFWEKIRRADHIIVISHFIKKEAVELYGFPQEKITPIHLGFDRNLFKIYPQNELQAIRAQYQLPENFILFVGSIEPRKNLIHLLQAYKDLPASIRKVFKLVLVGHQGWNNQKIMAMIEDLGSEVNYCGYIPDEALGKIYNLARLLVYPSFYEGFGLPPLEAMASGCPVLLSRAASLPEVGGDAVFYIDPHDVGDITASLQRILTDDSLRDTLRAKGMERAAQFSWEKAAAAHLKVFEETCQR